MKRRSKASSAWGCVVVGFAALALVAVLVLCAGCGAGPDGTTTSVDTAAGTPLSVSTSTPQVVTATTAPKRPGMAGDASSAATTPGGMAGGSAATSGQGGTGSTTRFSSTTGIPGTSTTTAGPTTTTAAGEVVLTVAGPSGTTSFTMAQLRAMDSVSGFWGVHKGDPPYAVNRYKGVALVHLLSRVGGLGSGPLKVNTSDNFPCVWEAERLAAAEQGTYQVWDRLTGVESTASVRLIVAYEMDASPLGASVGPLRLVPVTSVDSVVSEGKYSPFMVVSVEVL